MYYFKCADVEVSCDTVLELREAVMIVSELRAKAAKEREATLALEARAKATTTDAATTGTATTETATRHRRTSVARRRFPEQGDIAALPFVEGGLSWKVVKRYGKKLGRDDLRQLRSDLFQRQKMGK
jgi:hypothetical protein